MGLFQYIKLNVFIISLAFGLFAVYITMPDTRKIYVYPNPENIDVLQYKDKTDTCFKFKQNRSFGFGRYAQKELIGSIKRTSRRILYITASSEKSPTNWKPSLSLQIISDVKKSSLRTILL